MTELQDIEDGLKFMENDKEHRSLKDVIDSILDYEDKKRRFAQG